MSSCSIDKYRRSEQRRSNGVTVLRLGRACAAWQLPHFGTVRGGVGGTGSACSCPLESLGCILICGFHYIALHCAFDSGARSEHPAQTNACERESPGEKWGRGLLYPWRSKTSLEGGWRVRAGPTSAHPSPQPLVVPNSSKEIRGAGVAGSSKTLLECHRAGISAWAGCGQRTEVRHRPWE